MFENSVETVSQNIFAEGEQKSWPGADRESSTMCERFAGHKTCHDTKMGIKLAMSI